MVETETVEIPFYLMPIAAVLGSYALFGVCRIIYILHANTIQKKSNDNSVRGRKTSAKTPILSWNFVAWIISVVAALILYAKIVAQVENAMALSEYAHFDPYEILGIQGGSSMSTFDVTEVKAAYRRLAKEHHPDKPTGDARIFQRIHTAYRALTTDKDIYDKYGHPDGPLIQQTLSFALPGWLLQPTGPVAAVLLVLYLAMFAGLIYVVMTFMSPSAEISRSKSTLSSDDEASMLTSLDGAEDTHYLASTLGPDSTHLDVLWAIATTPETVALTQRLLDKLEIMKKESLLQKQKKKGPANSGKVGFEIEDSGWADDEDQEEPDEATLRARAEEAQKELHKQQLAEATGGAAASPMEGIDEGVLGQNWVERTLERFGQWPPTLATFPRVADPIFQYQGKAVTALEHPAVRRNLCFTMGRLNSIVLNTHTELLEASSKKLIDQTYFKASLEYRQRAGLLLEASLRIAVSMQSYRLAKTIIETVSMFKIGVRDPLSPKTLEWFTSIMTKQYTAAGLPKLILDNIQIEPPSGENEIVTDDSGVAITLSMDRAHAEAFTRIKVAQCQAQGIPPQIALQAYREGWWILVRVKKVKTDTEADIDDTILYKDPTDVKSNPLSSLLTDAEKEKFASETAENRLLVAWPMIVQNMAQKSGKVRVQFKAPSVPGQYTVCLAVKSQEFLGTDQEIELPMTVVDATAIQRAPRVDAKEQKDGEEGETTVTDESKKTQ